MNMMTINCLNNIAQKQHKEIFTLKYLSIVLTVRTSNPSIYFQLKSSTRKFKSKARLLYEHYVGKFKRNVTVHFNKNIKAISIISVPKNIN